MVIAEEIAEIMLTLDQVRSSVLISRQRVFGFPSSFSLSVATIKEKMKIAFKLTMIQKPQAYTETI